MKELDPMILLAVFLEMLGPLLWLLLARSDTGRAIRAASRPAGWCALSW